jgi:hypothetical protein
METPRHRRLAPWRRRRIRSIRWPRRKSAPSCRNFDVYHAMNGSYALWTNNNYGTNGATWQQPTSTFDARLVKFGAQFDF